MVDYNTATRRGASLAVRLRAAVREGRVREIASGADVALLRAMVALAPPVALPLLAQALDWTEGYNRYKTSWRHDGYTRRSLDAVETAVETGALGGVFMVRGMRNHACAQVKFYGARYSLDTGGFEWGYRGTGPLGLVAALVTFGMDREEALERVLGESGDDWILKLTETD